MESLSELYKLKKKHGLTKHNRGDRFLFEKYDARISRLKQKVDAPKVSTVEFTAESIEQQMKVQAERNKAMDGEWNEMHKELGELKELMGALSAMYEDARMLRLEYRKIMTMQSSQFLEGVDKYFNYERIRHSHFCASGYPRNPKSKAS